MATSRADGRAGRRQRAVETFRAELEAALDVLEPTEFAWHDCYGEVTPPDGVIDDLFIVVRGR